LQRYIINLKLPNIFRIILVNRVLLLFKALEVGKSYIKQKILNLSIEDWALQDGLVIDEVALTLVKEPRPGPLVKAT